MMAALPPAEGSELQSGRRGRAKGERNKPAEHPLQGVLRSTFLISSLAQTVSHGQDYLPERPGNGIFN